MGASACSLTPGSLASPLVLINHSDSLDSQGIVRKKGLVPETNKAMCPLQVWFDSESPDLQGKCEVYL
jgi:hypothetical protein